MFVLNKISQIATKLRDFGFSCFGVIYLLQIHRLTDTWLIPIKCLQHPHRHMNANNIKWLWYHWWSWPHESCALTCTWDKDTYVHKKWCIPSHPDNLIFAEAWKRCSHPCCLVFVPRMDSSYKAILASTFYSPLSLEVNKKLHRSIRVSIIWHVCLTVVPQIYTSILAECWWLLGKGSHTLCTISCCTLCPASRAGSIFVNGNIEYKIMTSLWGLHPANNVRSRTTYALIELMNNLIINWYPSMRILLNIEWSIWTIAKFQFPSEQHTILTKNNS